MVKHSVCIFSNGKKNNCEKYILITILINLQDGGAVLTFEIIIQMFWFATLSNVLEVTKKIIIKHGFGLSLLQYLCCLNNVQL